MEATKEGAAPPAFERAGPREMLFFDPKTVRVGIVTCGGLCPGTNDIIRSMVLELCIRYGAPSITGFRYGLQGLVRECGHTPLVLDPVSVKGIQRLGGSILGSSRGYQDIGTMVTDIDALGMQILFMVGGDGTHRAAEKIANEIYRRKKPIAIVGLPKTIDNDLHYVSRTFGFSTAVSEARSIVQAAHVEAHGVPNGIGIVKLMGRTCGWIAAHAALANSEVDFCLIPEVPFRMEGADGLLASLEAALERNNHAVIVAAEGAGQDLAPGEPDRDESGNLLLKDICAHLKDEIKRHFAAAGIHIRIRYIDPSYIIRGVPANPEDAVFCQMLAQNAVHAAMSGRTNMLVGYWSDRYTHVPLHLVTHKRKRIDPTGSLWQAVLSMTGQPPSMGT
jgi:6-phosphofructokinase 1